MIKYFKKAFQITNDNIVLTTPLVLFLFLFSIYLGVAKGAPENIQSAILLLFTILFMISAFLAGWFFMVKKAVALDKDEVIADEEKSKASFDLLKEVPTGIGEYFLPFVGASIFYTLIIMLLIFITYQIGMHFIGNPGLHYEQLKTGLMSAEALKEMLTKMPHEQMIRLQNWNILLFVVTAFYSFITMFWGAQIVMKTKNPVLAFFQSVGIIFKHPLSSMLLFLYISFINFIVSLINTVSNSNPILYFISMLIYFYFLVYIVVLIFLYYDREEVQGVINDEQAENNSDSGSDSDGEN